MMQLTREELNNIIDSATPYVKTIYNRTYERAIKEIGDNEQFRSIVDSVFDKSRDLEIENIKNGLNEYFNSDDTINIIDIKDYFYTNKDEYGIPCRGSGNTFTKLAITTICQSTRQAIMEKLTEYIGIKGEK